jgi:hypothetical protein
MQIGAKAGRKKFCVQTECNTVTKLRIRKKGFRRDSNPRPRGFDGIRTHDLVIRIPTCCLYTMLSQLDIRTLIIATQRAAR